MVFGSKTLSLDNLVVKSSWLQSICCVGRIYCLLRSRVVLILVKTQ